MQDSDQPRTVFKDLRCAGCSYELRGLDQTARCPECGTPILRSIEIAAEVIAPSKKIPRLGRAYVLITLATLAGAPALFLYALLTLIERSLDPLATEFLTFVVLPILLAAGTILPGATIASVPRNLRPPSGFVTVTIFSVATLLGVVLMILGGPHVVTIGAGLGAVGCIVNLTLATAIIGSVVPGWHRLGSARQSRNPLLATVAVILLGRLFLPSSGVGLTWLQDQFLTWGQVILIAVEALLAIGAVYLLINRLWLAARLLDATIRKRNEDS